MSDFSIFTGSWFLFPQFVIGCTSLKTYCLKHVNTSAIIILIYFWWTDFLKYLYYYFRLSFCIFLFLVLIAVNKFLIFVICIFFLFLLTKITLRTCSLCARDVQVNSIITYQQAIFCYDNSPLSSNRQHYEIDDCLEENREDY